MKDIVKQTLGCQRSQGKQEGKAGRSDNFSPLLAAPAGYRSHCVLWRVLGNRGRHGPATLCVLEPSLQMPQAGVCGGVTQGIFMQDPRTRTGRGRRPPSGMRPASASSRHGGHRHSRSGTSSTQGYGGVNDSFRHLHPSGDSTGRVSAGMACGISGSTVRDKRKRAKMKSGAGPEAETQRDATWLPVHQKPARSRQRCGLVGRGPSLAKDIVS